MTRFKHINIHRDLWELLDAARVIPGERVKRPWDQVLREMYEAWKRTQVG